jgi:DNA end-binding protein Ku
MPTNPPARKTFTINVQIGMVTVTMDGYSSTEESATRRGSYIKKNGVMHPVGVRNYDKVDGADVAKSDIIKCIESADGTLVPVSDEELAQFLTEGDPTAEFVGFLSVADYHASYLEENCYQIRPTSKVGGKTVKGESPYAKPFALFQDAMAAEGVVAIVKHAQRSTPRYYAWLPDGTLRSLRYDEEVRAPKPLPLVELSEPEKQMGRKLVQAKRLTEVPVLEDTTNAQIAEFVEAKAKIMAEGGEIPAVVVVEKEVAAPSDDLMALLNASL